MEEVAGRRRVEKRREICGWGLSLKKLEALAGAVGKSSPTYPSSNIQSCSIEIWVTFLPVHVLILAKQMNR